MLHRYLNLIRFFIAFNTYSSELLKKLQNSLSISVCFYAQFKILLNLAIFKLRKYMRNCPKYKGLR